MISKLKYPAFILALIFTAVTSLHAAEAPLDKITIKTQAGAQYSFDVEIAATLPEQEKGLMFRTAMPENHGMLFAFDRKNPRAVKFWMKDTLIPLDMIFVGQKGDIVGIIENAVPESLAPVGPEMPVTAVIELNGGIAARRGIKAGDRVEHAFFE